MNYVSTKPAKLYMHVNDDVWKGFDFGPLLPSGETLSGTPTVTITGSGLTKTSVQRNATTFTDPSPGGRSITASEGVIALFSATAAGEYELLVECDTSGSQHLALASTIVVQE